MKIVLTLDEVTQIVGNYLFSVGKLEKKTADVNWRIDIINAEKSYVKFEQKESIKE